MRGSETTLIPVAFGVATAATAERASAAFASASACAASLLIFSSSERDSATRASTFSVSSAVKSVRFSAATASRIASISAFTASRRSTTLSRYDISVLLLMSIGIEVVAMRFSAPV